MIWAGALGAAALAPPRAERLPGETFRDCEACEEMVVVPAGAFQMGSTAKPSQSPPHKVSIAHGFRHRPQGSHQRRLGALRGGGRLRLCAAGSAPGSGERAMTNVSWSDAKEYVAWMSKLTGKNYRLPNEAEWEYAARGGHGDAVLVGQGRRRRPREMRGLRGEVGRRAMPVGSFRPNGFGLYDTAGNAAEWVEDCWNPSFAGAPATARRGRRATVRCGCCAAARFSTRRRRVLGGAVSL